MSYEDFLKAKESAVAPVGFEIEQEQLHEALYPFQRDIVQWALRLGRAAIFADCGMGKTLMQLEWAQQVCVNAEGRVLILAPLAVAQQTAREAERFGIGARYLRADDGETAIVITNYEMMENFIASDFVGIVLDESSILKAYDGKTRTLIIETFARMPYRLACTATPAPNDFMELGNHCEFLGVMSRAEMLSMYFVHDGGDTSQWRLKGHAEKGFWRWVCQWAVTIRKPSDLGYEDGAFQLPSLEMHEHIVAVDHAEAWQKTGTLFQLDAQTLAERRDARKSSIEDRVAKCAQLAAADSDPWLIWCGFNDEGDQLEDSIPESVQVAGSHNREFKEKSLVDFAEGKYRVLISKPSIAGHGMNFQRCANVAFVGLSDSFEQFYQAIRRCWRFGQTKPVHCHVIISETEGAVLKNIQRKEADAQRMADAMAGSMREIMQENLRKTDRRITEYKPQLEMRIPAWMQSEAA